MVKLQNFRFENIFLMLTKGLYVYVYHVLIKKRLNIPSFLCSLSIKEPLTITDHINTPIHMTK